MDKGTLIGVGGGLGIIVAANVLEGGNPASLMILPAMLLVFGGTIGAAVAGGTIADTKAALKAVVRAFTWKPSPPGELVPIVVSLADKARREGLLTLEGALADVDDDFLKRGVSLAVDGTDPEELREILESEVDAKRAADKHAAKFFNDMGGYAPTIGIIGTVMGLVHVLENLSQPDKLGHLIAGAFVATLWGVMTANMVWLPVGSKLTRLSQLEVARMDMVIEGVLAVQAGANPRIVAQRLNSLLPAHERDLDQKAA
jgi:chemotaxis protein MotA